MSPQGCRRKIFCALIGATMALCAASGAKAQEANAKQTDGATANSQELLQTLQELASQVKTLNARLDAVTAEQAKSAEESSKLRRELETANARLAALEVPGKNTTAGTETASVATPVSTEIKPVQEAAGSAKSQTLEERLGRLEENQEFIDAKIGDQYQTKVESGSKYRVRFSGIFLLNLYGNRGTVDNQDFPELATEQKGAVSYGAFGGSLRQSQIGIEGFGPDILGARTSARAAAIRRATRS